MLFSRHKTIEQFLWNVVPRSAHNWINVISTYVISIFVGYIKWRGLHNLCKSLLDIVVGSMQADSRPVN